MFNLGPNAGSGTYRSLDENLTGSRNPTINISFTPLRDPLANRLRRADVHCERSMSNLVTLPCEARTRGTELSPFGVCSDMALLRLRPNSGELNACT